MNRFALPALLGAIAIAAPSTAFAQNTPPAVPFVGVSAGYHEVDDGDFDDAFGFEIDTGSPIVGVVAGVDLPVGESLFVGVEGNFHFGTDVIDNEYGASARLGFTGQNGSKFYVRGGYQEVDFDAEEFFDIDLGEFDPDEFDDVDTTEGDYLVGAGADFRVGPGALRLNVDTIAFDSIRATTGFVLTF